MSEIGKYTLADRPKWWLPRAMKWVSVLTAVLAFIMWIGSMVLEALDDFVLNPDANEEDSVALDFSYFADEIMWGAIAILFYAGVFWLLSLAGSMRVTKTATLFFKKENEKMLRINNHNIATYDAPLGEWV